MHDAQIALFSISIHCFSWVLKTNTKIDVISVRISFKCEITKQCRHFVLPNASCGQIRIPSGA